MLQDQLDAESILQPRFAAAFETLSALDLCLDALIRLDHLPVI